MPPIQIRPISALSVLLINKVQNGVRIFTEKIALQFSENELNEIRFITKLINN